MDIQIKNEEEAVVSCINGKNSQKKLSEAINNLESVINKVKTTWESTGADKETYILELEKQVNNLRILGDSSLKFFNTIESYIARVRQLRARKVGESGGGESGARFTKADIEKVIEDDRKRIESDNAARRAWLENSQ